MDNTVGVVMRCGMSMYQEYVVMRLLWVKIYHEMWYEYVSRVCGHETVMSYIHCVGRYM